MPLVLFDDDMALMSTVIDAAGRCDMIDRNRRMGTIDDGDDDDDDDDEAASIYTMAM